MNGYAKFWGVNKVHYGLCENGDVVTLSRKTVVSGSMSAKLTEMIMQRQNIH